MSSGAQLSLRGALDAGRLDNGLEVRLLRNADAPVITTVLSYRVGAVQEADGATGLAHFLEHMMFKGSARFAPGEIDRRTRALGGANNAFTTHDSTTYYFSLAAGREVEALDIEADRMRGISNAPEEIERERAVILEELAMYEAEPWEALDRAVQLELFGEHAYGRPIIGRREDVEAIERSDLEAFHRDHYHPGNAVLVVAGDLGRDVDAHVERLFAPLRGNAEPRPVSSRPERLDRRSRIELERGSVDRFVLALPAPAMDHEDYPALRMICAVLSAGRSGRLNDRLVERESLCSWVSCSLSEGDLAGALYLAGEVVPGMDAASVEAAVLEEIARLRDERLDDTTLARARRMLEADWIFAHERIEAQALTLAQALVGAGPDDPAELMRRLAELDASRVLQVARRALDLDAGSVFGWSRAVSA